MEKICCKLILLLAVFACAVIMLFSCSSGEKPIVQSGIEITETQNGKIDEETDKRAEAAIFSVLEYYCQKTMASTLPPKLIQTLKNEAERIQGATKEHPVSVKRYESLVSALENDGRAVVDEITDPSGGYVRTMELYNTLSRELGSEYVGNTLYSIFVCLYDYSYESKMEDYGEYGYAFLLEDAKAVLAKKATLINNVGKESFSQAVKALFFVSRLIEGGAHESDTLKSFTDEEILLLIDHMELSLEKIDEKGWELLLSYIPASREGTYISYLWACAKDNKDISTFASVMPDIISLLLSAKDSLDTLDAEHIRNMDGQALLANAFCKFGNKEWALFEKITSVPISDLYNQASSEYLKEEFDIYCEQLKTYTLDELKASVGREDFFKILEGYIGSKSYALSYLMK